MQSASNNFVAAVTGASVTWAAPQLFADWAADGYGVTGSIDDLSEEIGDTWTVTHALDDGLPADVHDQTMDPLGRFDGDLAHGHVFPQASVIGARANVNVSNSGSGTAGPTSFTLAAPSDIQQGDMMVAAVLARTTPVTIRPPAGWATSAGPVATGTNLTLAIYTKLATLDDHGASYTWTFNATSRYSAVMAAVYGLSAGGYPSWYVEAGGAVAETTARTTHTTPTITTAARQTVLLSAFGWTVTGSGTWTAPSGDTELGQTTTTSASANMPLELAMSPQVTAGSWSKTATSSASASLTAQAIIALSVYQLPETAPNGTQMSAAQYYSAFNTSSPVAAYDRDVAPMKLNVGPVGAAGQERVRLFTGSMADLPVTSRSAAISGTSATNRKLQKIVQPPAISGNFEGLTGSWPVAYALYKSGVYVSPPPRAGCRWWAPMHGSIHPMLPDDYTGLQAMYGQNLFGIDPAAAPDSAVFARPSFVTGPYLTGAFASLTTSSAYQLQAYAITLGSGADLLSQAGNAGRVEFWVRGDTANINGSPNASGYFGDNFVRFRHQAANGTFVDVGVTGSGHQPYVRVYDGTTDVRLSHSVVVPTDGAWHFIGAAWDVANKKLWITIDSSTTLTSTPSLVTTGLVAHDAPDTSGLYPQLRAWLPIAEVHITTGATANPDNYPWLNSASYAWTAGATVRPSQNTGLVALTETAPLRAIDLISEYAQAELAMTRCDENDLFVYLTLPYWAETAQQTQVDTLTTLHEVSDFDILFDRSRVRNSVSLTYNATTVQYLTQMVVTGSPKTPLPPGQTILTLNPTSPCVEVDGPVSWIPGSGALTVVSSATLNTAVPSTSYIQANTMPDGTGSDAAANQLFAKVLSWTPGSITLLINNTSGVIFYLANNVNQNAYGITGVPAASTQGTVMARDASADGPRGELGMTCTLSGIQDQTFAQAIANALVGFFALPRARLENLRVFGDPRRQPGDLVAVQDPYGTKISGLWRLMSISHAMAGGQFEQTMTAVQAWLTATWDATNWGEGVWGP